MYGEVKMEALVCCYSDFHSCSNCQTDALFRGFNALIPLKSELFMKQACRDANVVYMFFSHLDQCNDEKMSVSSISCFSLIVIIMYLSCLVYNKHWI